MTALDVCILCVLVVWQVRLVYTWERDVDSSLTGADYEFALLGVMASDENYDFRDFISIILICMWLKVFLIFRVTTFLGPLIKMCIAMVSDIFVFLILFALSLLMFACVGIVLFPDVEKFSSLYNSVVYLFQASLGEYDFTIFD